MKAPAGLAVVVPIRSFTAAKTRLADVLTDSQRRALAQHCAEVVLAAAGPFSVYVVTDDPEVAVWAGFHAAQVVPAVSRGLNEAATIGRSAAQADGFKRVLVVHADLPRAESLAPLADVGADVVIVPDRHRAGTNALVVPTRGEFAFRYGPGSNDAHAREAARVGLSWQVLQRDDLAFDLDTVDDLRAAGIDATSLPGKN